jgi:hypothetical protein
MEVRMMVKHLPVLLGALGVLCLVGCADVSKKDLAETKSQLEVQITQAVADLERKINATDAKYANMLALEQTVKNGVMKIDQNAALLETSGKAYLQILQTQHAVLKEQMKTVEDQLQVLQKKE